MLAKYGCHIIFVVSIAGLCIAGKLARQNELFERLFGGTLMCGIGVVFASIGYMGIASRLQLLRKGVRIRGKVIDKRSHSEGTNPIVEFEGQNGETQRKELCFARDNAWYVGGEIDLLYDPESEHLEPDKDKYVGWLFLIMAAFMGTVGICFGLSWLIFGG